MDISPFDAQKGPQNAPVAFSDMQMSVEQLENAKSKSKSSNLLMKRVLLYLVAYK